MLDDLESEDAPAIVGQDDHHVDELKRRCDDEHIDSGNSHALIS
jgi:hypothetical protein